MTVRTILAAKGRDVATITADETIAAAAGRLAERRIGSLVVVDQLDRVAGIISERDIVRAIAGRGAGILEESIASIMTRKVVTCRETDSVNDIMEIMTRGKFRHVPVVEGGRLVGVVSIGDVVKHRLVEVERETSALKDYILTA